MRCGTVTVTTVGIVYAMPSQMAGGLMVIKPNHSRGVTRCHWCCKFLSPKTRQATLKNPDTYYCPPCFQRGVEMEDEAMGLYDEQY